ncbi:MAG: hypothetical protein A2017_02395 [Lentisphaerae bacterium GWF2_44_16]|nr:MAG: hypothetical protein A2017_02395 [Lentisphaerae bacterium GWF2_44_16]
MLISIIILLISALGSAFFSGIETGNYSLNKIRLRFLVEQGKYDAILVEKNLKDPQIFIFTVLICNNIVNYIISYIVTEFYMLHNIGGGDKLIFLYNFIPWSSEIAAAMTLMFPMLIFCEMIPKNLLRKQADTLMYLTAGIQHFLIIIFLPFTIPLKFFSRLLTPKTKDFSHDLQNLNMQKLRFFLDESKKEGVISDHQNKMINKTMLIHIMPIDQVMIPVEKLLSLPESATPKECLDLIHKTPNLNRIPVYKDKKNNITGYVHFFDLITAMEAGKTDISTCIKKMKPLKWNITIQQAFYELQGKREPIAAVVDKNGSIIGVTRLKELVRHITGH